MDAPLQTTKFGPALTLGALFTKTVTWSVFVHPLLPVPVTSKVAWLFTSKGTPFVIPPVQDYEVAPDPNKVTISPSQTVWSGPAETFGAACTVTKILVAGDVHPFPSV